MPPVSRALRTSAALARVHTDQRRRKLARRAAWRTLTRAARGTPHEMSRDHEMGAGLPACNAAPSTLIVAA